MPIRVGSTSVVPTPPPTPTVQERLSVVYTAPDGSVWPMTTRALGYWVMKGAVAFGAVPLAITADSNSRGGETPRTFQYLKRLITWPLFVQGANHTAFIALWRSLGYAIVQTSELGPGLLVVTRPDGTSRMIQVYYQDGWQETQPEAGWYKDAAIVTLYAPNPWWLDTTEVVIERAFTGSAVSFFSPFLTLSSSQTLGTTAVTNPGQSGVWPDWEIDGPATGLTATRYNADGSVNAAFTLSATWSLGDTVTIKTDPQEILGPDGSSWISKINFTSGAVLWSLPAGDTNVQFAVSGSGAGTAVRLSFYPRYATG